MPNEKPEPLTVREYARQQRISLQTAYRRIWQGQVSAQQFYGRWLIMPDKEQAVAESA